MARLRKDRAKAEIETGSFSDISFLLIIFFVLTTTLSKPTGRLVEIPSAAPPAEQKKDDDKAPTLRVLGDRVLFGVGQAEGEEVTLPALKGKLAKYAFATKPEKERMVVVEVADDVQWDRYFKVVTLVAETGGVVALVEKEE